jgi:phosphotransferase family enzyme
MSNSVRVGDTVRRRAGPWTPAVHGLLAYLRDHGFDAAPAPRGLDEQGRAVLAFLPGDVHAGWPDPMPEWMYREETTLVGAAQLLRRYHDVVAHFDPPADARWRIVAPGRHELICHNDWAPYNALFKGHLPVAMLDWDNAGPGSRVWDVACSAYRWVPLVPHGTDGLDLSTKARRFARFCEAYGGVTRGEALEILFEELRFIATFIQAEADAGDPGFAKLAEWDVPSRLRSHAETLRLQTEILTSGGAT